MLSAMKPLIGKVLTAQGPVEPAVLGKVMMHEHLHSDCYDWDKQCLVDVEKPIDPARRELLMREAIPPLRACNDHGCHAYVDVTPPPWRAWPDFMVEASAAAKMHIILCTGFYCEMNDNEYWVKKPADKAWSFMRTASLEELTEFCTKEIVEGQHGTSIRAGAIKLGGRNPILSPLEQKTFRAGARAQKATGVHITTHCTQMGAETSQLEIFDREGVDLRRVVIGHTARHLMDPERRAICLEWMKRGANFLPTNLGIGADDGERWRPLVEAIHTIFDAGHGDKLLFGLDWAFVSESAPFGACTFVPPPPFLHMFTHTLPAFRKMGLTAEEEDYIMQRNPQRIIPVQ
jgi:predicted metal-dependent phosphotriesterase family hydrolase